jgi:hypothetical protein
MVSWATTSFEVSGERYPKGTIVVSTEGTDIRMEDIARDYHLRITSAHELPSLMRLQPLKLGMYQPWTANMDEGWTRWIFDTWEFPYSTLFNRDIREGALKQKYDVIVLPSMDSARMFLGHREGSVPPEYAGGIGERGLEELRNFVEQGGTLITLGQSCHLTMDHFNVPVRDVTGKFENTGFYCPSAILKVDLDTNHPITYGMDDTASIVLFRNPLLDLSAEGISDGIHVVARYPDQNPFLSGLLLGERHIRNRPALIEAGYGKGKIIMFGFRPQHRAQPEGTFMLFFNSLYYGQAIAGKK